MIATIRLLGLMAVWGGFLHTVGGANIAVELGQTATLPCTGVDNLFKEWQRLGADGSPTQLITLYISGNTTHLDEKPGLDTFNLRGRFTATADAAFTATITNTRASDDGRYKCDGSSGGEIIHSLLTYKLDSVSTQPVTGYVGGMFDVTCTADSKPAPSFNWTKQEDSSFTRTGATLQINSLTMNDTGTYVCTAYHAYASDTASVQLTVSEAELNTVSTQPAVTATGCVGAEPVASTMASHTIPKGPTGEIVFGLPVVVGSAVGSFTVGFLVGGAAVCLILRFRKANYGGRNKDTRNLSDRQYENVAYLRDASKQRSSGSDIPMETIEPAAAKPPQPVQPPQPDDDYQELRPAIYQSLQKH